MLGYDFAAAPAKDDKSQNAERIFHYRGKTSLRGDSETLVQEFVQE